MDEYQVSIFGKDCLVSFINEPDLKSIDVVREILNNLTDQIIKEQLNGKTL